jgi:cold shock CspA family protein
MLGTTTRYDRVKGYGFILPDDETQPDFFVLAKHIMEPKGRRWLMENWRVEFDPAEEDGNPLARNVRIISRPIAMQRSATPQPGSRS